MKTVLSVALGVILGVVVLAVGCSALLAGAADDMADEANKEQRANAITLAQYRNVKTGTSQGAVEQRFGEPSNTQESELDAKSELCISYNRRGGEFGDLFEFCFSDGRLAYKIAY